MSRISGLAYGETFKEGDYYCTLPAYYDQWVHLEVGKFVVGRLGVFNIDIHTDWNGRTPLGEYNRPTTRKAYYYSITDGKWGNLDLDWKYEEILGYFPDGTEVRMRVGGSFISPTAMSFSATLASTKIDPETLEFVVLWKSTVSCTLFLVGDLTISAGPQNPTDVAIKDPTSPVTGDWIIPVNHIRLTASDSDISLKSLSYDFIGDDPTGIVASLDRDTDCDGNAEIAGLRTAEIQDNKITFSSLDETISARKQTCYILRLGIFREDKPICKQIGASISPAQVEAYKTGALVDVSGITVTGTIIPGACNLTLTINIEPEEGGSVVKNPDKETYENGEKVTITATANEGYLFDQWSSEEISSTQNPLSFKMDKDYTITAYFKAIPPSDGKNHGKLDDPVNTATGEFYFEMPVLNLGGPLPLTFNLYYGSAVAAERDVALSFSRALGLNWLHNFQKLRLYKGDRRTHIIYDRGKILPFERKGNEWVLASTEDVPYVLKDDAGYYYLMDPEKELVYAFNPDRQLSWISDRNGNLHTLSYDASGLLSTVSDGLGRVLHFSYDGDRLISV